LVFPRAGVYIGRFYRMATISIHQPNFLPYEGIFQKIASSDIFIIMSHCQFTKNNFQNRFYYREKWLTMRCNQKHEPIKDKKYLYPREDWFKITNELPKLKIFDDYITYDLTETNTNIIVKSCQILGIKTTIFRDWETKSTGTQRLIDLIEVTGAKTYLSGVSGPKYLDMDLFKKHGIEVQFQGNPGKRALIDLI
jgi:hypothetical protein